jgi:hypothetical protein
MMGNLSEAVVSRLGNWKFSQALNQAKADEAAGVWVPSGVQMELMTVLAESFGNVGWFDGTVSDLVQAAVALLDERLESE